MPALAAFTKLCVKCNALSCDKHRMSLLHFKLKCVAYLFKSNSYLRNFVFRIRRQTQFWRTDKQFITEKIHIVHQFMNIYERKKRRPTDKYISSSSIHFGDRSNVHPYFTLSALSLAIESTWKLTKYNRKHSRVVRHFILLFLVRAPRQHGTNDNIYGHRRGHRMEWHCLLNSLRSSHCCFLLSFRPRRERNGRKNRTQSAKEKSLLKQNDKFSTFSN